MAQRLNPNAARATPEKYEEGWRKFWANAPGFDPEKLKG
jgi:hypothetical protein